MLFGVLICGSMSDLWCLIVRLESGLETRLQIDADWIDSVSAYQESLRSSYVLDCFYGHFEANGFLMKKIKLNKGGSVKGCIKLFVKYEIGFALKMYKYL